MPDNPNPPQVLQPTVTWNGIAQTALMAAIAAIGSIGTYQLAARPADGIPPAPAPAVTAVTLHEDLGRVEKALGELSDKIDSLKAPAKK